MRGERRYHAKTGDTLRGLVGEELDALVGAGSVFVDGARVADANVPLRAGAEVVVGRPRSNERCALLGEIAGLVAVDKPAALPSEPDRAGNASARSAVADELGLDERELHAVSRLDVGVSGVMLFARGEKENKLAVQLRERGEIHRRYVGIALRTPDPKRGRWQGDVDDKHALTDYVTLASAGEVRASGELARPVLLSLAPITGRKHQLRIHAARAGAPLLGDRVHGGPQRLATTEGAVIQPPRIALHAFLVSIRAERIVATVPDDLRELWRRLGGSDSDWTLVGDEAPS